MILEENVSVFHIKYTVGIYSLYNVKKCAFYFQFFQSLSWKDVEFCQRLYLHLLIWWCGFCPWFCLCVVLCLLICNCSTILHPWNETYLIMVNDLFNVLLDFISKYFIEDFRICVYQGYWPVTACFWCVFTWLWY
jgi:hypothetical protein